MTPGHRITAIVALFVLAGCADSGTGPEPAEVDLDVLFAAATADEMAAVEADWAARSPMAEGVVVEETSQVLLGSSVGTLRVVSHLVDGNRHYGLVIGPEGAAPNSLPVVVFAHGGDNGVSTLDVALVLGLMADRADDFVFVVPSFRSERLVVTSGTFQSQGDPSPWDRDVDDALALLEVAFQLAPAANPGRIGALGFSRGGGVALLMAIRDPRIDLVVEFAGPTDFFGPYVRTIVEDALDGQLTSLPGMVDLNERFIQPLAAGTLSANAFRLELVRRSPALFAARLPATQVHHGTLDTVVHVSQAESLIAALAALERAGDETYLYVGAGHSPLEMDGSPALAIAFLDRLLAP